jgi:phosphatidylglycerophosphate synthase
MSNHRVKSLTPSIITSIRVFLAPLFFLTVINDLLIYSLVIFLFAMVTDVLDGYFSRKWDVSSSKGAYYDIIADFILVFSGFSAFVIMTFTPIGYS